MLYDSVHGGPHTSLSGRSEISAVYELHRAFPLYVITYRLPWFWKGAGRGARTAMGLGFRPRHTTAASERASARVCVCVCFVTIGLGHSSRFLCLPWRSPLLKLRARTGAAAVACAEPGRAPRLGTVAELLHERATGIQTHQPAAGGERITVVVHAARTWTAAKRDGPDRLELRLMMALIASGCVPFHCSCGTTWTVVQRDGPDHLDLLLNAGERVVLLWPGGARG